MNNKVKIVDTSIEHKISNSKTLSETEKNNFFKYSKYFTEEEKNEFLLMI